MPRKKTNKIHDAEELSIRQKGAFTLVATDDWKAAPGDFYAVFDGKKAITLPRAVFNAVSTIANVPSDKIHFGHLMVVLENNSQKIATILGWSVGDVTRAGKQIDQRMQEITPLF